MNLDFLLNISSKNKDFLNSLYNSLDNKIINECASLCFKDKDITTAQKVAIVRRICDLKVDPLINEIKKYGENNSEKINKIRDDVYKFCANLHQNLHQNCIDEIKNADIGLFWKALFEGFHKIGINISLLQEVWQRHVIDKNFKIFSKIKDPFLFIKEHKLYQMNEFGEICERIYAVIDFKLDENQDIKDVKILPYCLFFEKYAPEVFKNFTIEFDNMLENLGKYVSNTDEFAYLEYFKKLQKAILCTDNNRIISAWRDAEIAWMQTKLPIQIGHMMEYYEDIYTHSVALEWDIRINENEHFNDMVFKEQIKNTFFKILNDIAAKNNQKLNSLVSSNIDKTQLYICTPLLYYGAQINGLFSAQVVPNDEFVSANCGKKIFAFINFVYESAKSKPKMKINGQIFNKEFLNYSDDILKNKPEIWKRVYEITTIGHEFGHILFIDDDTELKMNSSGMFKLTEEYKATTGGLVNFFFNEINELKMPVFNDIIKRSIGLIAWQNVDEVKPYYVEGLLHLCILFESSCLKFENEKLIIDFSEKSYENFKEACLKNYKKLALDYVQKIDSKIFLQNFIELQNGIYLPKQKDVRKFVEFYYQLYLSIGNELQD